MTKVVLSDGTIVHTGNITGTTGVAGGDTVTPTPSGDTVELEIRGGGGGRKRKTTERQANKDGGIAIDDQGRIRDLSQEQQEIQRLEEVDPRLATAYKFSSKRISTPQSEKNAGEIIREIREKNIPLEEQRDYILSQSPQARETEQQLMQEKSVFLSTPQDQSEEARPAVPKGGLIAGFGEGVFFDRQSRQVTHAETGDEYLISRDVPQLRNFFEGGRLFPSTSTIPLIEKVRDRRTKFKGKDVIVEQEFKLSYGGKPDKVSVLDLKGQGREVGRFTIQYDKKHIQNQRLQIELKDLNKNIDNLLGTSPLTSQATIGGKLLAGSYAQLRYNTKENIKNFGIGLGTGAVFQGVTQGGTALLKKTLTKKALKKTSLVAGVVGKLATVGFIGYEVYRAGKKSNNMVEMGSNLTPSLSFLAGFGSGMKLIKSATFSINNIRAKSKAKKTIAEIPLELKFTKETKTLQFGQNRKPLTDIGNKEIIKFSLKGGDKNTQIVIKGVSNTKTGKITYGQTEALVVVKQGAKTNYLKVTDIGGVRRVVAFNKKGKILSTVFSKTPKYNFTQYGGKVSQHNLANVLKLDGSKAFNQKELSKTFSSFYKSQGKGLDSTLFSDIKQDITVKSFFLGKKGVRLEKILTESRTASGSLSIGQPTILSKTDIIPKFVKAGGGILPKKEVKFKIKDKSTSFTLSDTGISRTDQYTVIGIKNIGVDKLTSIKVTESGQGFVISKIKPFEIPLRSLGKKAQISIGNIAQPATKIKPTTKTVTVPKTSLSGQTTTNLNIPNYSNVLVSTLGKTAFKTPKNRFIINLPKTKSSNVSLSNVGTYSSTSTFKKVRNTRVPISTPSFKQTSKQVPISTPSFKQTSTQITTNVGTGLGGTTTKRPPPPRIIVPPFIVPNIGLGGIGFAGQSGGLFGSSRRNKKLKQRSKPSLLGIFKGRGKVSQKKFFTGLEIRGL